MAAILQRRIALALDGRDGRGPGRGAAGEAPGADLSELLDSAALVSLFDYYTAKPSDVRRNLLLVVQAALTLAIDDPDAERIERRHVELAIAEAAG